jgi:cysteine-rich repeat protein
MSLALWAGCEPEDPNQNGPGGDKALAASTVVRTQAAASLDACPNGGELLEYGIDDDQNGVLDDAEVDGDLPICHGKDGKDGSTSSQTSGGGCTHTDNDEGSVTITCDDGTTLTFKVPVCGNGLVETGEACDDANTTADDGCSATCTIDTGYLCRGTPSACAQYFDNRNGTVSTGTPSALMWMKCSQGQTWVAASNSCSGTAGTFQYCSTPTNSCNGGTSNNTAVLDDGGISALYTECKDSAYLGYTDWRVSTKEELKSLVRCSNDTAVPLADDVLCGASPTDYTNPTIETSLFPSTGIQPTSARYWSATSAEAGTAWSVSFYNGDTIKSAKQDSSHVRCIRSPN